MASVLDPLAAQFEAVATQHDATAAAVAKFLSDLNSLLTTFAAGVTAAAAQERAASKTLTEFMMANAAQLVAEATARILKADADALAAKQAADAALAAEQAKEATLQTALDAANAKIAELTPNVVPADEVAALDAALHPAPVATEPPPSAV